MEAGLGSCVMYDSSVKKFTRQRSKTRLVVLLLYVILAGGRVHVASSKILPPAESTLRPPPPGVLAPPRGGCLVQLPGSEPRTDGERVNIFWYPRFAEHCRLGAPVWAEGPFWWMALPSGARSDGLPGGL